MAFGDDDLRADEARAPSEDAALLAALDQLAKDHERAERWSQDHGHAGPFTEAATVRAAVARLRALAGEVEKWRTLAIAREGSRLGMKQLHNAERARAERAEAALEWYGEQARLARLIHAEGDRGRHALANDGGQRARAVLAAAEGRADTTKPSQ